jgi:hypothetical protein
MHNKIELPLWVFILTIFISLVTMSYIIFYFYSEIKLLQQSNIELINQLHDLQCLLAELKIKATEEHVIISSLNYSSEFYRDLLKYLVYTIAIISALLFFYLGYSYFFSNYIEVNSVYMLLKKANYILTGLISGAGVNDKATTSYTITDESTKVAGLS